MRREENQYDLSGENRGEKRERTPPNPLVNFSRPVWFPSLSTRSLASISSNAPPCSTFAPAESDASLRVTGWGMSRSSPGAETGSWLVVGRLT